MSHDTGRFPALSADQLRLGATLLAAVAGAGVGLMLGLAYQLVTRGDGELAAAMLGTAVVLGLVLLFLVLQTRVIAQLVELRFDHEHRDLERRLLALEVDAGARALDGPDRPAPVASPTAEDVEIVADPGVRFPRAQDAAI